MQVFRFFFLGVCLALLAFAADVDGTWKIKFQTPDGQTRENTLVLKAEGETLTGTLSSRMGESKLQDGTVKGDDVAFTVVRTFNGNEFTQKYTGKITGNTMKLKTTMRDREVEMEATKQ
jgi:hypothetical protein